MNWNKAEELLERYYEGRTSAPEEQELRELLSRPDLPKQLQAEAEVLQHLQLAGKETSTLSDEALFARLDEHLQEEPPLKQENKPAAKSVQLPLHVLWQIAAAFALLALGYWAGISSQPEGAGLSQQQQPEQQTEQLTHIRQEVAEMKQMLAENSPSQRIRAVNNAQEMEDVDAELMHALIQTMHFDENVHVRMAAIKALLYFRDQPMVRSAMVHSLRIQQDPNVQLQLIDGLVEMDEKEAVPQMQELLRNKELQEAVRLRLQESIGILI